MLVMIKLLTTMMLNAEDYVDDNDVECDDHVDDNNDVEGDDNYVECDD